MTTDTAYCPGSSGAADGGQFETPVAFLIFNRPETTEQVFRAIAAARPATLLVIADGPRPRDGEAELCCAARAVTEKIDWPCRVLRNYAEANMGCRNRVASGLDWVFSQVDRAIILEDDCLPHPAFFPFCEELLLRYENDTRVAHITGTNLQENRKVSEDSYYFSRIFHVWGWATWRRAWEKYDVDLAQWPQLREPVRSYLGNEELFRIWSCKLDEVHARRLDTWDYQWALSCWASGALAIIPEVNLISNIGFGPGATHTTTRTDEAEIPRQEISFPLRHPRFFFRNAAADSFTERKYYLRPPWLDRKKRQLRRLAGKVTRLWTRG